MSHAKHRLILIAVVTIWGAVVAGASDRGWVHCALATSEDTKAFECAARDLAPQRKVRILSLALIEDGRLVAYFNLATGERIDGESSYQVASLGKWLAVWGVMMDGVPCPPSRTRCHGMPASLTAARRAVSPAENYC
jgi:hypothetical protein